MDELDELTLSILDFQFVTTDGDLPSLDNSTPIEPGDEEGRASIVFFNQASMYRCSALDGSSVAEAKSKGIDTTTNYGQDVQEAFQKLAHYYPM